MFDSFHFTYYYIGVLAGFFWLVLLGVVPPIGEAIAQSLYSVPFYNSDWIHGVISLTLSFASLGINMAFLQSLRSRSSSTSDFPTFYFCLFANLVFLGFGSAYWLEGATIHTPYLNGILDQWLSHVMTLPIEPPNAMSTN
jgi:hypothetical protein